MEQVNIIGIDLAKRSFQLHGARADGSVAFRRKVSRERLLYFLGALLRGWAAPNLLATILFEKYGQHVSLNRQRGRYAREGIDLSLCRRWPTRWARVLWR